MLLLCVLGAADLLSTSESLILKVCTTGLFYDGNNRHLMILKQRLYPARNIMFGGHINKARTVSEQLLCKKIQDGCFFFIYCIKHISSW